VKKRRLWERVADEAATTGELRTRKRIKESHVPWLNRKDPRRHTWLEREISQRVGNLRRKGHTTVLWLFHPKTPMSAFSLEKKKRVTIRRIEVPSFLSRVTTNSKKKKIQKSPFGSSSLSFLKTSLSQA